MKSFHFKMITVLYLVPEGHRVSVGSTLVTPVLHISNWYTVWFGPSVSLRYRSGLMFSASGRGRSSRSAPCWRTGAGEWFVLWYKSPKRENIHQQQQKKSLDLLLVAGCWNILSATLLFQCFIVRFVFSEWFVSLESLSWEWTNKSVSPTRSWMWNEQILK